MRSPPLALPSAPAGGTTDVASRNLAGARVANASSSNTQAVNHASYDEMILAAILALKKPGARGSSKRAIAKYIKDNYTDFLPNHSELLTDHLKNLKSSGGLVMVKKSYALPRSTLAAPPHPTAAATASSSSGPKRGRGRPPSVKSIPQPIAGANPVSEPNAGEPTVVKRGRGRPKKADGQAGTKKGTGKPKKRPRGNPKSVVVPFAAASDEEANANPNPNAAGPSQQFQGVEVRDAVLILKEKFADFQSKVKQAVDVLKPQATSPSGVAAIQELEVIASMDINS